MQVLIPQPTDELAIFIVPAAVAQLPSPLREGWCFWPLGEAIRAQQGVIPIGPPREITYDFVATPEEVDAVVLRHPCDECTTALVEARTVLTGRPGVPICVAQCVVDYLVDPREMWSERFSPSARRGK